LNFVSPFVTTRRKSTKKERLGHEPSTKNARPEKLTRSSRGGGGGAAPSWRTVYVWPAMVIAPLRDEVLELSLTR
jgi:hypothetical protein